MLMPTTEQTSLLHVIADGRAILLGVAFDVRHTLIPENRRTP